MTHHIRHHLSTVSSLFFLPDSLLSPGVQPADSVGFFHTFTWNSLELIDSTRSHKLNTADLQLIVTAYQPPSQSFNQPANQETELQI